jgi:hypothetical protein
MPSKGKHRWHPTKRIYRKRKIFFTWLKSTEVGAYDTVVRHYAFTADEAQKEVKAIYDIPNPRFEVGKTRDFRHALQILPWVRHCSYLKDGPAP